jgi:hypothetical protein
MQEAGFQVGSRPFCFPRFNHPYPFLFSHFQSFGSSFSASSAHLTPCRAFSTVVSAREVPVDP